MEAHISSSDLSVYIANRLAEISDRMQKIDRANNPEKLPEYEHLSGSMNELLALQRWAESNTIRIR